VAKELKRLLSAQLQTALRGTEGVVLVNLGPMTVEKSSELRRFLRGKANGARLRIVHNRTARVAFREAGFPEKVATALEGPTAVAYGGDGATSIAKTLVEWTRTDKAVVLKGAVAEGEFYDAKGVQALARLPDRKTLRAMLCGAILGPARGLAVALAATPGGVARATKARIDAGGFPPDPAPGA
jgi:large subunit ribosomal protein L10